MLSDFECRKKQHHKTEIHSIHLGKRQKRSQNLSLVIELILEK